MFMYNIIFNHYCCIYSREATENMVHRLLSLKQLQVNVTCSYVHDKMDVWIAMKFRIPVI